MVVSTLLILAIVFGGFALTYFFAEDEPFLWRLAAGNVVGSAIFGLAGFILASIFGLSVVVVSASLSITLAALLLFRKKEYKNRLRHDWRLSRDKLQGGDAKKLVRVLYYIFFLLLFLFFFERAMFETSEGIFTGSSQNLGDLPFHLGAIFGFADGQNFPPENPSYSGARFSYPFIADFITACFVKLGAGVKDAMLVQNIAWAFSLLVVLERFVFGLVHNRLAGKIAPALLFFSGGLGFFLFFKDFWEQGRSLFDFLWNLPRDYTISDNFRWGNSLVVLFITQRSLLLGMPLAIIILAYLWKVFATENTERFDKGKSHFLTFSLSPFLVGLLAGMLPLIHLHSLAVLFVVTAFLFILRPEKWRDWIAFGVGVCLISVPELLWSMSGSATRTSEFFSWHFGWDSRETNFFWFWIKNTGILIPLIILGIFLTLRRWRDAEENESKIKLLLFYLPFVFCFVVANTTKLAPWEWDNIKILIYWFVGSIPFVALTIAWAWQRNTILKIAAAACFILLIFSGALDVWRTVSGQIKSKVFEKEAVEIADQIKKRTAPRALFLNAPTYNSAVVLTGRRSLMRYPGHLSSHGIDYRAREEDVKRIYEGTERAEILLRKYEIDYVLVSPEERNSLAVNENFFRKYPLLVEGGQCRVYKVNK